MPERDLAVSQSEEALRASERRYRQLFEQNLAGVFQATLNGVFLDCNEAYAGIHGYTRDEILALRLWDLHPRNAAGYQATIDELRRTGSVTNIEVEGARKDGVEIWTLESIVMIGSQYEAIPYVQGTVVDVTERRQMRDELTAAEAKFRHLVERSVVGVFIVQEGRFTYVNPRLTEIAGYTAEQMLNMPILDLVEPEHRQTMADLMERHMRRVFPPVYSFRIVRGDGGLRDVEVFGSRTTVEGRPAMIGTFLDVTSRRRAENERKRLQRSLKSAAQEWRSTVDTIQAPIVVCDTSGLVTRLNRAAVELLAQPFDAVVGQPLAAFAGREPWKKAVELLQAITQGSPVESTEAAEEGRTWNVSVNLGSGRDADETRVVIAIQELTRVMRLQESLRRSEQMSALGRLVAGVAHEVRNPLFGMTATLDAFEARFGSQPEHERYFVAVRDQLDRLTDLIQDLLEYGKATETHLSPGTIDPVIDLALALCEPLAAETGVTVLTARSGEPGPVAMEARRLVQVFRNLIDNAIRHSPPGESVLVSTTVISRDGGRWVQCTVEDSGSGFAPEDLPKAFDPFFSRRRGGTGLGLSIVQRVVEDHGGFVVARNGEERGARVVVALPEITASGSV